MFVVRRQGVMAMLYKCALFRQQEPGINQVILALDFEGDGTSQKIGQYLLQLVGRPSRRRLATEVIAQAGRIAVSLLREGDEIDTIQEDIICEPYAIMQKTGEFVEAAFQRACPLKLEDPMWRQAIRASCDAFLVMRRSDMGSNNLPSVKHTAHVIESDYPYGMFDFFMCLIHVLNWIRSVLLNFIMRAWDSIHRGGPRQLSAIHNC